MWWLFEVELHLNREYQPQICTVSDTAFASKPAPTGGMHFKCGSGLAREGRGSVSLKKHKKKRSPKAPLFQTANPNQASFLWRTRCGWAAASPRRFLRSASYSV